MIKKLVFLLTATFIFINLSYAAKISEENKVKNAYQNWCSAIGEAKGNPAVVVKLYAPGAILIPTLSSKKLINTNGGLNDYFKKLTSLKDIQCKSEKSKIRMHGKIATNSGFYTFRYINKANNEPKEITARYTFVYKKINNEWLIENHHSSKTPQD